MNEHEEGESARGASASGSRDQRFREVIVKSTLAGVGSDISLNTRNGTTTSMMACRNLSTKIQLDCIAIHVTKAIATVLCVMGEQIESPNIHE